MKDSQFMYTVLGNNAHGKLTVIRIPTELTYFISTRLMLEEI